MIDAHSLEGKEKPHRLTYYTHMHAHTRCDDNDDRFLSVSMTK